MMRKVGLGSRVFTWEWNGEEALEVWRKRKQEKRKCHLGRVNEPEKYSVTFRQFRAHVRLVVTNLKGPQLVLIGIFLSPCSAVKVHVQSWWRALVESKESNKTREEKEDEYGCNGRVRWVSMEFKLDRKESRDMEGLGEEGTVKSSWRSQGVEGYFEFGTKG